MYAVSTTFSFEAAHRIDGHPKCYRTHGHTWTVTAHVSHEDMDKGLPRGGEGLSEVISSLVSELDHRDLDVMLPNVRTTPTAVAAWFFERAAHRYPGLTRVEVCHSHEGGSVSKT
jgi:6-pyruvoyl-tetrahydropterin synthase